MGRPFQAWKARGLGGGFGSVVRCSAVIYLPVLAAQTVVGAEFGRPVAEINVAEASAAYGAALEAARGFPVNVRLSFLGEGQVAFSSMDGRYSPSFGHTATSTFHLTIDVFRLNGNVLAHSGQLRFDTQTSDAEFVALPSGKMVVGTGRTIRALDRSGRERVQSSLAQVCGSPSTGLNLDEPFRTNLVAGSEEVAFVGVVRAGRSVPPDGPPVPVDDGWGCWFSTADLSPIAQAHSRRALDATSARDRIVYLDWSWSLTPEGQFPLSAPSGASCDVPALDRQFPKFYLLHAEPVSVFRCRRRAISVIRGDRLRTITMKGADAWYFRTDAWNVPLAIFTGGSYHIPVFGGNFGGMIKAVLVNYASDKSALLPEFKISAPPPIYAGPTLEYAISPNGSYVAVLHGTILSVYQIPAELLH